MSIIALIIWLALLGVIVWAVTTYIPMPAGIAKVIVITAVVAAVFIVLKAFGVVDSLNLGNVPKIG